MFYKTDREIEWPKEVYKVFNPNLHDAIIEKVSYDRGASKLCLNISYYDDRLELIFEDVEKVSWDIEKHNDLIMEAHLYNDGGMIVASFEAACLEVVSKKMTISGGGYSDKIIGV